MRALLLALVLLVSGLGTALASHPQTAGGHTATFDHKTGNEWWVEVIVTGSPSRVEARDDGGAWVKLSLRSWGAWAASFRIEEGHRVQFRASWSDGASVESCWFTHPAGVEQCEGTPPPPPPSGNYTFTHGGGNEWWVEVKVSPMPGKVEAMDTNGAWVPLSFRSWGEWANSFRIEPGHQVRFRAFANEAWHESCWFTHPEGKPVDCGSTPPPPPPPTNGTLVSFTHGGGNDWWVEAKVSPKPAKVEAMDTGGGWVALSFKSWGEWAGSFRIEEHHLVRFRATYADGSSAMSCWFTHPGGLVYDDQDQRTCTSRTADNAPPPTSVVWPREGSYVRYYVDAGEHWPSGSDWSELNITLRYLNGSWQEEVGGWSYLDLYDDEDPTVERVERVQYTAASRGPTFRDPPATADETTYTTKKNGGFVDAPAFEWFEEADPDCPCGGTRYVVHEGTGLQLSSHFVGRMSNDHVDVKDTDAPIAPGDPEPTPPPAPAWPTEGSYVTYSAHEWSTSDWSPYDTWYNATYTYTGGDWTIRCVGTTYHHEGEGQNASVETFDSTPQWGPLDLPLGPRSVSAGTPIKYYSPANCWTMRWSETIQTKSQLLVATNQSGAPFTAKAWYADETAAQDAEGHDFDAWWDMDTGLVLRWETLPAQAHGRSMGNMTDTDAPLRRA